MNRRNFLALAIGAALIRKANAKPPFPAADSTVEWYECPGLIDEMRVTAGVARYPEVFLPAHERWVHFAVVRRSDRIEYYRNGVRVPQLPQQCAFEFVQREAERVGAWI